MQLAIYILEIIGCILIGIVSLDEKGRRFHSNAHTIIALLAGLSFITAALLLIIGLI